MLELVRFLAQSLSSRPDEVTVSESEPQPGRKEILLKVSPSDLCAVIGKNGRTIRAVRVLMAVAASKKGQNYLLKVDTDFDAPDA
ncbi:MAG: KH domain-containing protein [Deltaproteobacteria bacterium]|jgi:predicted RNA-binding protein YlqC (UPF0109 family)|nr:KH domain-containing protein [Deltaproteobacteria bacterium]